VGEQPHADVVEAGWLQQHLVVEGVAVLLHSMMWGSLVVMDMASRKSGEMQLQMCDVVE
jgi:hypothetical protein